MPINKTTLPGTEVPVTAILDGVGGFAPYTYDISWLVQPDPNITFAVSNNNEVRISVGANVPLAVYNGTLRGVVTDAAGRERVSDLPVTLTVGIEPLVFMAMGFDDYYGTAEGPTGVFLEASSPWNYTLTQPIASGGAEALKSYGTWDQGGVLGIEYINNKGRWLVSGLEDSGDVYIVHTDNNTNWTVAPIDRPPEGSYSASAISLIQNPDDENELLIQPSFVANSSALYNTGMTLRTTDGGDTFNWVASIKHTSSVHGVTFSDWGGNIISRAADAYGIIGTNPGQWRRDRATLAVDTAPNDTWFPAWSRFDESWWLYKSSGFESQGLSGILSNGEGSWIALYSHEGLGMRAIRSTNNGFSWTDIGDASGLYVQQYDPMARVRYWNSTIVMMAADDGTFSVSTDHGATWTHQDSWSDFVFEVNGKLCNCNTFDVGYDEENDEYLLVGRASAQDFSGDTGFVLTVSDITDVANSIVQILAVPEVDVITSINSNHRKPNSLPAAETFTNLNDDILRVTFNNGSFIDESPLSATWTAEGSRPPTVFNSFDGYLNSAPIHGYNAGRIRGANIVDFWDDASFISPFADMNIHAMHSRVWGRVYAGGENGRLIRSSDEGVTWLTTTSNFGASTIRDITYLQGAWIIVGDDGKVARGTSGDPFPSSFSLAANSTFGASNINAITARSRSTSYNTLLIAGDDGKMAVSLSDEGLTWTAMVDQPFGTSNIYGVHHNEGGCWVIVGAEGKIAYANTLPSLLLNSNQTWTLVGDSSFGVTTIRDVTGDRRGIWVAVGDDGKIGRSIDNAITWTQVASPFGNSTIWHVNTDHRGTFIAAGADGKVAISKNYGETWNLLDVSGTFSPTDNIRATYFGSTEEATRDPYDLPHAWLNFWGIGGDGSKTVRSVADRTPLVSYWASPTSTDYHFAENESFTIQFWAASQFPRGKYAPAIDHQTIIGSGSTNATIQEGWWGICTFEDANFIKACSVIFQVYNGAGYDTIGQGPSAFERPELDAETFHHIAVVRNGGVDIRIYVNGVLFGSSVDATFQRALDAYNQLFLGASVRDAGTDNTNWDGAIMDLRITKGVAMYTSNFTPPGKMVGT